MEGDLPLGSGFFVGGLKPFHHDFKLCFVGGDVAWFAACEEVGTGAGCGFANGCCEDEAGKLEAMFVLI